MDIKELQANWDRFGKIDPLWSIVTAPTKRGGKWGKAEFFRSGEAQIAFLMSEIASIGVDLQRERCLDFGCGVGRLTQSLCAYFKECHGVDIAPSMIRLANKHNRYTKRCHYHLNEKQDLSMFSDGTFDLIYSILVLQHMKPDYSKNYIKEFLRIIKPGGLIVFQVPGEAISFAKDNMPDSGFKASISIENPFNAIVTGEEKTLLVKVQNISNVTWPATAHAGGVSHVRVGNRWLDLDGNIVVNDDGRCALPGDIKPLETFEVYLKIKGPDNPGRYLLEVDLVQEGVVWFKDKGSKTSRVHVRSKHKNILNGYGKTINALFRRIFQRRKSYPVMEMYEVRKEEVVALIEQNGGEIIEIRQDKNCGDAWLSFTYFATKGCS